MQAIQAHDPQTRLSAISATGMESADPAKREEIHVAFGVDADYFRGMGVTITSIVKNNPKRHFIFHIFAFSVSDDNRRRIEALASMCNRPIHIHVLSTEALQSFREFPCFKQHSLGTFIRLLIPNELHGIAKRMLYLDADILCFGDIAELLSIDIDDCIAAAAHDEAETTVKTQVPTLGLKHGHYFNAGVMYIDIDKWVADDIQNTALGILAMRELVFADQDALNMALDGHIRYVGEKWNYRYHLVDFLSRGKRRLSVTKPCVFMHFTGPVKPWHDWCVHEAKTVFLDYQTMSSWSDVPLDRPKSVREFKLFSKFLIKQNRPWEGIGWHIKYLWARFAQSLRA